MYKINIALLGVIVNETRNEFGKNPEMNLTKKVNFTYAINIEKYARSH